MEGSLVDVSVGEVVGALTLFFEILVNEAVVVLAVLVENFVPATLKGNLAACEEDTHERDAVWAHINSFPVDFIVHPDAFVVSSLVKLAAPSSISQPALPASAIDVAVVQERHTVSRLYPSPQFALHLLLSFHVVQLLFLLNFQQFL